MNYKLAMAVRGYVTIEVSADSDESAMASGRDQAPTVNTGDIEAVVYEDDTLTILEVS